MGTFRMACCAISRRKLSAVQGLQKNLMLTLNKIENNEAADIQGFEELLFWVYFIGGILSMLLEIEMVYSPYYKRYGELGL